MSLDRLARLGQRQRMVVADVDVAHGRRWMGTGAQPSIRVRSRRGAVLVDSPRVDAPSNSDSTTTAKLPLGPGMHGIGRGGDDAIGLVIDPQAPLLRFCVDRRGVWLAVADGVRGIHVNGRPVRRMAMLRPGDAIHVDGSELTLMRAGDPVANTALPAAADAPGDPRLVLRGRRRALPRAQHHPRAPAPGRARGEADIRIDSPAFPEHHARLEHDGGRVLLRDLDSGEGSAVNGRTVATRCCCPATRWCSMPSTASWSRRRRGNCARKKAVEIDLASTRPRRTREVPGAAPAMACCWRRC